MKLKFILLAVKNLARYKTRNLLTGSSIALGAATLIMGLSLTDGIVRQTILGFTGTVIEDVMIFTKNGPIERPTETIAPLIDAIPGVDYHIHKVSSRAMLFSDHSSVTAQIIGVQTEDRRRSQNLVLTAGAGLAVEERFSVLASAKLAQRLKIDVGERLAVIVNLPGGATNAADFRLGGIFEVKTGLQFADHLIYMNLPDAQELMGLAPHQFTSLGIYLHDVEAVDRVEQRLNAVLAKAPQSMTALSWKKTMKGIMKQYYLVKYVVLVFSGIFLIIVCVGVTNAMLMSMSERTREIGTLMALGARRNTIAAIFSVEALSLSALSALCGSVVGIAVTLVMSEIGFSAPSRGAMWLFGGKALYPYLTISNVLFSYCFVVGATMVGMVYPIWRSTRMHPVEALGYV